MEEEDDDEEAEDDLDLGEDSSELVELSSNNFFNCHSASEYTFPNLLAEISTSSSNYQSFKPYTIFS